MRQNLSKGENWYKAIILRTLNPYATLQSIGDQCHVSRERIRQILKEAKLPTSHLARSYNCLNCKKEIKERRSHSFCSNKCRYEYHNLLIECDQCHTMFRRRRSEVLRPSMKHNYYFCSKRCQGYWLSSNYGFVVNPDHRNKNKIGHKNVRRKENVLS